MAGRGKRPGRAHGWLTARPYAHRGLHDAALPENSLAAFRAAIAAGHGIECDVRRAADDVPHIFHDVRLERLTGKAGLLAELDSRHIGALRLADGTPPPTLQAMLDHVAGRVPILLEIKAGRASPLRLCRAIADLLADYRGPVAVMSFDPRVAGWFASHRRAIPRGLVWSDQSRPAGSVRRALALAIARARPHFVARDIRDQSFRPTRPSLPTLFWTIRSGPDHRRARAGQGQIIYERRRLRG